MKYSTKVRYSVTSGKRVNVEKTQITSSENSTQWKVHIFLANKDFYPIQKWVFVLEILPMLHIALLQKGPKRVQKGPLGEP